MPTRGNDTSFSSELDIAINENIFDGLDVIFEDMKMVFYNNIVIPITSSKELNAGFEHEQLYIKNIKRTGHCFSSDARINLIDCARQTAVENRQYLMMNGDSPGMHSSILLRAHEQTRLQGAL
jgi:hypothetical protein